MDCTYIMFPLTDCSHSNNWLLNRPVMTLNLQTTVVDFINLNCQENLIEFWLWFQEFCLVILFLLLTVTAINIYSSCRKHLSSNLKENRAIMSTTHWAAHYPEDYTHELSESNKCGKCTINYTNWQLAIVYFIVRWFKWLLIIILQNGGAASSGAIQTSSTIACTLTLRPVFTFRLVLYLHCYAENANMCGVLHLELVHVPPIRDQARVAVAMHFW